MNQAGTFDETSAKSKRVGGMSNPDYLLIGKWAIDFSATTASNKPFTIEVKDNKIRVSGDEGYEAAFDGKEYPVKSSYSNKPTTIIMRQIDDRTIEQTWKEGGKITGTWKWTAAPDGKTLRADITTAAGEKNTSTFARQ